MSEQASMCDVLLEAAEYLCKLGTNLKSRTDNLKEKRLRRDKLKNTHSVQKIADKILVICDLSKKSLENVENGMKKILTTCAENTSGGRRTEHVKDKNDSSTSTQPTKRLSHEEKFQMFTFQSQKIKVPQKISIRHYTSCNVLVKSMPVWMEDKYPVYFNCKLYRARKRKSLKPGNDCTSDGDTHSEVIDTPKIPCNDSETITLPDSQESQHFTNKETVKKKTVEMKTKNKHKAIHIIEDSSEEDNIRKDVDEPGETDKETIKTKTEDVKFRKTHKKSEGIHTLADSGEDENIRKDDDDDRTEATDKKTKINNAGSVKKRKTNTIILDSSEDEGDRKADIKESKLHTRPHTEQLHSDQNEEVTVNKDCSSSDTHEIESKKDDSSNGTQKEETRNSVGVDDNSTEPKRPMLKCVDIKKLLKSPPRDNIKGKPSIVVKSTNKVEKCYPKAHNMFRHIIRVNCEKSRTVAKKSVEDDDDTYWKNKRKQVRLFKPKKFYIKLTRQPVFTKEFLQTHNVKRIINQKTVDVEENRDNINETIECGSKNNEDEFADGKEINNDVNKTVQNTTANKAFSKESIDMNKLKDALLDSDSDKLETASLSPDRQQILDEAEKLKNSLLIDSDSDGNEAVSNSVSINKMYTVNVDSAKDNVVDSQTNDQLNDKSNTQNKDTRQTTEVDEPINSNDNIQNNEQSTVDKTHNKDTERVLNNDGRINLEDNSQTNKQFTLDKKSNKDSEQDLNDDESINSDDNTQMNEASAVDETDNNDPKKGLKDDEPLNTDDNNEINQKSTDDAHNNDSDEVQKDDEPPNTDDNQINQQSTKGDTQNNDSNRFQKNDEPLNADDNKQINEQYKDETDTNKNLTEKIDNFLSDDNIQNTILYLSPDSNANASDKSKKSSEQTPDKNDKTNNKPMPKSKRKRMMESMRAKRMLLTHSSSSETDDEQLRDVLRDIKESLLKGTSGSEDDTPKKKKKKLKKHHISSSSSSVDDLIRKRKTSKRDVSDKELDKETISQVDGNMDDSLSIDSQMGRSRMKASSSNGQSSDTQDPVNKECDRLTNLKSLHKSRRADSTSVNTNNDSDTSQRSKDSKPKIVLDTKNFLEAESSSSDGASDNEMEGSDLDPIPDLNGDVAIGPIGDFAKEDLLGESDASSSHNDDDNASENANNAEDSDGKRADSDKDGESDDEDVKLRRRKANAISSDSDGGSKKTHKKTSDFDESGGESSEPAKKTKRKKNSDSDASAGASSSEDAGKKKRRRIKQVRDSDMSGSDSENEGRKHGRKNIRRVMGKDQLEEATKKAARQEKERIARIAERQKVYNNLQFDESGKPDEVVLEKVVLDFDPETKEPLIEVDRGLVKKLKPHQANGIKFMWDACFESVKRIKKDKGSGCILAHCMGLGKTLQVVSLTHTLLTHTKLTGVRRVLVVCPLSTVLNWVSEFRMWLEYADSEYEVDVYELSRFKQNSERAYQMQEWFEGGGVCVLGYEMFRNLSADNKKFRKKMLRSFQESLVDPGPDLVVCDEGHLLKNEKTRLSQSMNRVRTLRRIVLTGTPLQNNLKEYYCMVQFVKPNLLGKYNEYLNRFVNPITNGQYTDSTEHDIRVMKRRSHVLHTMLDGAVQRRDYGVLAPFLPPKHEYVLFITLTEVQTKLYQHYLDNYSRKPQPGKSSGFLFPDFQSLQRIWTHPLVLKYNSERYEILQQKKRDKEEEDSEGSLADFIDDESTPEESSSEESSDESSDMSDDSRKKAKKKKKAKKAKKESKTTRRGTRANPVEQAEEEKIDSDIEQVKDEKYENPTEWWIKMLSDDELEDMRHSHKLVLLFDILRQCEAIGDKLLVFSQSLYSLDLIEHFLRKVDEATQEGRIDEKLCGHVGSWAPGIDYFRLDGSISCENRSLGCKNFNREDNPRARLFLISTRAGGLGINLVAANRVIIFDVSWNPSHDVQSIFRVYRFGQKKPCYIYRFLAMGTMEEKIYERQVTKQAISKRVIDEQQIDRHYAENDLAELYRFEPTPTETRPTPALPKDRLFAEMLKDHETQIYKFHEHDSLLENKEEETLTEEERKAAWDDFENEKNRPPPVPFANAWPMHNGMAPGALVQQHQTQLAYSTLATMLRKTYPAMSEQDLATMISNALFNANSGILQKMYSPVMNPMAMNPAMNQAGAMSGPGGLQYEPPWQRQQRQQQQMRLQQLMQHQQQQSAGAKYYAGGLGSRDPVAMAMQQQRAREIMLGEQQAAAAGAGAVGAAGAGGLQASMAMSAAAAAAAARNRPRGRPAMQPRAPNNTLTAADVVQLDSD